jgi:hypothetical protein
MQRYSWDQFLARASFMHPTQHHGVGQPVELRGIIAHQCLQNREIGFGMVGSDDSRVDDRLALLLARYVDLLSTARSDSAVAESTRVPFLPGLHSGQDRLT